MLEFLNTKPNKPNKIDLDESYSGKKNSQYHADMAKYFYSQSQTNEYRSFKMKTKINKNFYANKQWDFNEDVEAFLKDESGQHRNRIKVTQNTIRPMVEQFRGNAIRMTINASAHSISKKSIDRKDRKLQEKLLQSDLAEEFPGLAGMIRKNTGVGKSVEETSEIFDNYYVDEFESNITNLISFSSWLNDLKSMQSESALNLALSGISVIDCFEHGGHLRNKLIESEDYFFDPSCRKIDHTDAEYKGLIEKLTSSEIYEMYQNISLDDRSAIEKYISSESNVTGQRVPVIKCYWKDISKKEFGYVKDEYGYPQLTRINFKEDWEEKPKYTDKDLIEPPKNSRTNKLFKNGNKKRNSYVTELRYCYLIPGETISYKNEDNKSVDIILESGVYAHQETESVDLFNVKFPIKVHCWSYVDGEILSPVDDAINPQRFINRVLSVAESQINSSGGTNITYDKSSLDDDPDAEMNLLSDINQGNPIGISTRGMGITNTIGSYDATPKQGTYNMFNIVSQMKQLIQDTTGINEGLRGESTGGDQLVGVTQLLIQKGSLMQEPFYNALAGVFKQVHNFAATVGKRIYLDNERELAFALGDEGSQVVKLSKDMRNEDFRVFIKRDNTDEIQEQQANQMLNVFLQYQLIDATVFADNYGRSNPTEVVRALRKHTKQKIEAQKEMQESQNNQMQQAQQQESEMINYQQAESKAETARKEEHEINKINAQGKMQIASNMAAANNQKS